MDKYDIHKRVEVRRWLAAIPLIDVHFTGAGSPVGAVGVLKIATDHHLQKRGN